MKTGGSRGYETAFLKMRVGHLLRREVEGEEKVNCESCGKKRSPWGGAGLTGVVGKIVGVAKGWVVGERNECESN